MNCSREVIEAYLDEELDPVLKSELEQHLSGCRDCSETYTRARNLQQGIRTSGPYYDAPAGLHAAVRDALRREAATVELPRRRQLPWRYLAFAASVMLALSLGWNYMLLQSRVSSEDALAQNVVSNHVRSLMENHLLDVVSTDQHTVKPWFTGKLDFAPTVKDFAPQGFPLIGGRVDYLDGRKVAALVYQRRKHVINVFTWPASQAERDAAFSRNGFNSLRWTAGGMTYWAVSDVARGDLQELKELNEK